MLADVDASTSLEYSVLPKREKYAIRILSLFSEGASGGVIVFDELIGTLTEDELIGVTDDKMFELFNDELLDELGDEMLDELDDDLLEEFNMELPDEPDDELLDD